MARPPLRIQVKKKDQKSLEELLVGGVQQVRVVLRAIALLQLARGLSAPSISGVIPLTPQTIRKVGHRYEQGGLERALYEKDRPGAAAVLEDSQRQRIIAMVCSDPPEGRARWTVRLVAEEAVKRRLVSASGKRNDPGTAPSPRPQAVAGKKCGGAPGLTGMEQRMKEPYEEGVANHSAPSFALGAVKCPVKRKQGYGWAGYRASKICNQGADAVTTAEGHTISSENRELLVGPA